MNHRRLLVVDDDETIRATIELALQVSTDWEVLTAGSGKEALSLAQTQQLDGILLDVMMPDIDGVETLHQLRSNSVTQTIPVIFVTAKVMAKEQQKLNALGVKGVISKPFDVVDLVNKICCFFDWVREI